MGKGKIYTKEILISKLKELATELGRSPSQEDIKGRKGFPSLHTFENYFGSWTDAKKEAGLELYKWGVERAKEVDFNPFKHMFEFGYLYGVLLGDGSITKSQIILQSKDLDFINYFRKNMKILTGYECSKIGNIPARWRTFEPVKGKGKPRKYLSKPMYQTAFAHTKFMEWMRETSKRENWKDYRKLGKEFEKGFLKGIFDSEGNISLHHGRLLSVRIYGADKQLIQLVYNIMKDLGFEAISIGKEDRNIRAGFLYWVRTTDATTAMKFYDEIGITIKRKVPSKAVIEYTGKSAKRKKALEEAYPIAMKLRKDKGWGGMKISHALKNMGYDIGIPAIEDWIYQGAVPNKVKRTARKRDKK